VLGAAGAQEWQPGCSATRFGKGGRRRWLSCALGADVMMGELATGLLRNPVAKTRS
jgi:hypothetical protein